MCVDIHINGQGDVILKAIATTRMVDETTVATYPKLSEYHGANQAETGEQNQGTHKYAQMYSALDGRPTPAQAGRNVLAPNTGKADDCQGPVQAQAQRHRRRIDTGEGHASAGHRRQTVVVVGLVLAVSGVMRPASLAPSSSSSSLTIVVIVGVVRVVVVVVAVCVRDVAIMRPDLYGIYGRRDEGRQREEGGQRPSQGQQGAL